MPFFKRTQKENGTYEGSQVGNLTRSALAIGTGLGDVQAVLFDYKLGKFKVNVNPGMGKKNFQIIGNDAAELKADYDKKLATASTSFLGKTLRGGKRSNKRKGTRRA
jgi:hypothetical protein